MGDRVIVLFKDSTGFAPGVYGHWLGGAIGAVLRDAASTLRKNDPGYSAARMCAAMCERASGNSGVGLVDAPQGEPDWEKYSHGDRGVVVVDCETGAVEQMCGYAADEDPLPKKLDMPE